MTWMIWGARYLFRTPPLKLNHIGDALHGAPPFAAPWFPHAMPLVRPLEKPWKPDKELRGQGGDGVDFFWQTWA